MSNRQKFLSAIAEPPTIESVTVPRWGLVFVRGLTGDEWDEYEEGCVKKAKKGKDSPGARANRALLVRFALVDEAGKQVFEKGDEAQLADLPAVILSPIARIAGRLSMGDDPGND